MDVEQGADMEKHEAYLLQGGVVGAGENASSHFN